MRAKIGLMVAAGLLLAAPANGQDTTGVREMSPSDLYTMLHESEAGIRCYPVGALDRQRHDQAIHVRFLKIRPWLVAAIGEAEFETLKQNLAEEQEGIYYTGCPSEEQQMRDDRIEDRALREMERRAKAARAKR